MRLLAEVGSPWRASCKHLACGVHDSAKSGRTCFRGTPVRRPPLRVNPVCAGTAERGRHSTEIALRPSLIFQLVEIVNSIRTYIYRVGTSREVLLCGIATLRVYASQKRKIQELSQSRLQRASSIKILN